MRLGDWAVIYAALGVGLCVVLVVRGRRDPLDLFLVVLCWPVYAPFVWSPTASAERRPSPIAALLPDDGTMQALARKLATAAARVAQMDEVLARPDLELGALALRITGLRAAGHESAAHAADRTRLTVERLVVLRGRARGELAEAEERLRQLDAQARIVRVVGPGTVDLRALAAEVDARVDRLDAALEDPYLAPFE